MQANRNYIEDNESRSLKDKLLQMKPLISITTGKPKRITQSIAFGILGLLSLFVILILIVILGFIIVKGISVISWDFLTSMPAEGMTAGGIYPAIIGTLYLILGSIIVAFPIGILSGIYTHEYAKNGFLKKFIKMILSQNTIHKKIKKQLKKHQGLLRMQ